MIGIPPWVADYQGIPFAEGGRCRRGVDCYGLVRLVYADRLGVSLPALTGDYERLDQRDVLELVATRERASHWQDVTTPRGLDCVLLRVAGRPIHFGLYLGTGLMMHAMPAAGVVVESLRGLRWGKRVIGYARYRGGGH